MACFTLAFAAYYLYSGFHSIESAYNNPHRIYY
jgi:hypothetical protein